jgi:hypothetical protein
MKRTLLIASAVGLLGLSARAGSHTWDFTEAFSNADGTIQFLELRECCGGMFETGINGHTISSNTNNFVLPGPALTPPTSNKHYLIATADFAALPGAPTPDAIIPGGTLPFFFSTAGDSVTYAPWDTWNFGALPTDGINSLKRNGTVSANDPTNYAGTTGSVDASPSTAFCDASDGSLASCPCANPGNPDSGCDNAQTTGGVKINVIAQTTSPANATLTGTGFSTMGSPTSIVIRSTSLDPSSPIVFGDGLRCINSSPLVRLAATVASAGTATHTFGHGAMAGAGTFFYQLWYRNTPSAFCTPSAFNLSNGEQLVW